MRHIIGFLALAVLAACQTTQTTSTIAGPDGAVVDGQTYVLAAIPAGIEATHAFCARPGARYVITARPGTSLSDLCGGRDGLALSTEGDGRYRFVEDGGPEIRGRAMVIEGARADSGTLMLFAAPSGRFAHFASTGDVTPPEGTGTVVAFDLAEGKVNLLGRLHAENGRLVADRMNPATVSAALEAAGEEAAAKRVVEARPAPIQARCRIGESSLFGTAPVECIYTELR